jgi:glutamate dehydrogenase (NADP+)
MGKRCLVSGSGNVSQYTIEKLINLGAKAVTASDSNGYIYDEEGIDAGKLAFLMDLKNERRGRIQEYAEKYSSAVYTPVDAKLDHNPLWKHKADCAFPSATQNEINGKDGENLVRGGVKLVAEGANMPCTPEAVEVFHESGVLFAPGKAANAGGVAVSGLEMAQNSARLAWSRDEVDSRLQQIMKNVHTTCLRAAEKYKRGQNYVDGANIGGFIKVADAMLDQGLV